MSGQVIEDLINDSGEGGLSGAMARSSTKLSLIPVNDLGILHDADTPEDYKALLEIHNRRLIRPVAEVSLHKEKLFFDSKIAMLLELVGETGSVSGACKRMQMSYSAGWKTINTVEKQAGTALIERNQGGASGGSSELTKEGRKLLERFRKLSAEVSEAAERAYEKIFSEQSE